MSEEQTKTLTFYGSSDDNFCYDINGKGGDEIGCYDETAAFRVKCDGDSIDVVGRYSDWPQSEATWAVGVAPSDEDKPKPDWPISIDFEGYSARVSITVPKDAEVIALPSNTEEVGG